MLFFHGPPVFKVSILGANVMMVSNQVSIMRFARMVSFARSTLDACENASFEREFVPFPPALANRLLLAAAIA